MMKQHKTLIILTSLLTLAPVLVGLVFWDRLPDRMAVHFGEGNTANGWSSKPFAVFGIPASLLAVHLLCVVLVLNDPRKKNIARKMLHIIFWFVPAISWMCCFSIYGFALGKKADIGLIVNLALGILFIMIGNYLPKSRQNYTAGIRLPWTLNSEENWNRTHRLAGKLWVLAGAGFLLNSFFQQGWVAFAVLLPAVLIPMGYSFWMYRKGI